MLCYYNYMHLYFCCLLQFLIVIYLFSLALLLLLLAGDVETNPGPSREFY